MAKPPFQSNGRADVDPARLIKVGTAKDQRKENPNRDSEFN